MQLDRLTIKSQEALQEAQRIAQGHSHQEVDGEHLLLAMIGQADSLITEIINYLFLNGTSIGSCRKSASFPPSSKRISSASWRGGIRSRASARPTCF